MKVSKAVLKERQRVLWVVREALSSGEDRDYDWGKRLLRDVAGRPSPPRCAWCHAPLRVLRDGTYPRVRGLHGETPSHRACEQAVLVSQT